MGVNIIVAYCKGNGIGKNNALPWYIPQDLKHFSNLTKGNNNNSHGKNEGNFDCEMFDSENRGISHRI